MYSTEVDSLYKPLLFLEEEGMTFSQSTSKMISPSPTVKFISVSLYQFPYELLDHLLGILSLVDEVVDVGLQNVSDARKDCHFVHPSMVFVAEARGLPSLRDCCSQLRYTILRRPAKY